jgi:hypothetical protein
MADPPTQFGPEQWSFIVKTRAAVKADPKAFFSQNNWRQITPNGGRNDSTLLAANTKTTVGSFYVRPICCWVPHLLIANHIPTCPHCKMKDHIDLVKSRWTNAPKLLYGISSHKYLDTMLYFCTLCDRTFTGYHKQSLRLDASVVVGYFDIYLGHDYAMDEQLYAMICEFSSTVSTSIISRRLCSIQHTEYLNQYQLYLKAVGMDKVKPPKMKKQKTISSMLPKVTGDPELDRLIRDRVAKQSNVTRCRMLFNAAQNKFEMDITFRSILKDKENHNIHGRQNVMKGLGTT